MSFPLQALYWELIVCRTATLFAHATIAWRDGNPPHPTCNGYTAGWHRVVRLCTAGWHRVARLCPSSLTPSLPLPPPMSEIDDEASPLYCGALAKPPEYRPPESIEGMLEASELDALLSVMGGTHMRMRKSKIDRSGRQRTIWNQGVERQIFMQMTADCTMLRWSWTHYLMVTEMSSVHDCEEQLGAQYTSLEEEESVLAGIIEEESSPAGSSKPPTTGRKTSFQSGGKLFTSPTTSAAEVLSAELKELMTLTESLTLAERGRSFYIRYGGCIRYRSFYIRILLH